MLRCVHNQTRSGDWVYIFGVMGATTGIYVSFSEFDASNDYSFDNILRT
jgi:hypothetical protein